MLGNSITDLVTIDQSFVLAAVDREGKSSNDVLTTVFHNYMTTNEMLLETFIEDFAEIFTESVHANATITFPADVLNDWFNRHC